MACGEQSNVNSHCIIVNRPSSQQSNVHNHYLLVNRHNSQQPIGLTVNTEILGLKPRPHKLPFTGPATHL